MAGVDAEIGTNDRRRHQRYGDAWLRLLQLFPKGGGQRIQEVLGATAFTFAWIIASTSSSVSSDGMRVIP